MNSFCTRRATSLAFALATCGALAAGAAGVALLYRHTAPSTPDRSRPMLLAPMIGVIDGCVKTQGAGAAPNLEGLARSCSGPEGSAAALVESTLSALQPHDTGSAPYPLGYTLPVPLLQLFRTDANGEWAIDGEVVGRLVRTVRDTNRPLILYLFSTHFSVGASLEQALVQDPSNLAQTRDGPLPPSSYYGAPIYNWSFASTQTELTARRMQAARALLDAVCHLPAHDVAKIRGVTLLGELHHLFPDFQGGMGFGSPYRVTDYSPQSAAGFRQFLQKEFRHIDRLNRVLGADYATFDDVEPPARDIRTEPLKRYTDHIDSFAHGGLPIAGWAYAPRPAGAGPAWVHVFRNGVFIGKTPVDKGRQDVLQARPEFGDTNTGWRLDLDFRQLPTGMHRIDVFLEQAPGRLTPLGTRRIAIMDRQQSAPEPLPQKPLPASAPADSALAAHIDMPAEQSAYYYNPLVPLWHSFRGQQVADYLQFFNDVVNQSCLAGTPHYTHQIIPFANPSWDGTKFAIGASLQRMEGIRLGVSLYGEASYGSSFAHWYAHTGHRGYGVTEFHPLKPLDTVALEHTLKQHAAQGAEFLSFFLEPRWHGQVATDRRNIFSMDPENGNFGSDHLYESLQYFLKFGNSHVE